MRLRALEPGDATAAASLIRAAFQVQSVPTDPPPGALTETAQSVAAKLLAGGGACVEQGCGTQTPQLVAAVLWQPQPGALYVGRLAVDPASRRQGLARALLAAAEAEARRRGLGRLVLGARIGLADNRRLFAACGFIETGFETHAGYNTPTSVSLEMTLDPPTPAERAEPPAPCPPPNESHA